MTKPNLTYQRESRVVRRDFPRYRQVLCWIGFHSGVWLDEPANACTQRLDCEICGGRMTRARHTWDSGWKRGGGIRTCRMCDKTETRGMWKTVDDLCRELNALGVEAKTKQTGRGPRSSYSIDINRGPIRHVEIVEVQMSEGVTYYTAYVIPDARPTATVSFRSVRVRSFPLFGRVIDVRWTGNDRGTGSIGRLKADLDLKAAIISAGAEIEVGSSPLRGWVIMNSALHAPSPGVYACYERVAGDLIGAK